MDAEQRKLLVDSYDAVVGIYSGSDEENVRTRHEEIAVLAKNFSASNPPSSPRTRKFLEYHNLASSSFSLLSSPGRSTRLISQNFSNYVSAIRADTCAAAPNNSNEVPLPAQPPIPTVPLTLPPNPSTREGGPAASSLPNPGNHQVHASSSADVSSHPPYPSQQNKPQVLNAASHTTAPTIEAPACHPSCPNTPFPRPGPAQCVVGDSNLVRDGVPFLLCHTYGGPDAEDDAMEYGVGADFLDSSIRSKFSFKDGSLCQNMCLYLCRTNGCGVQKALDRRDPNSVKVHVTGCCNHASGSLAMIPKHGGKNGLPPSIHRFVRSYIQDKLNAPHASLDDLRPEVTARNICLVLQSNPYFLTSETKDSMKEKIRNFVINFRQRESKKKREKAKSSSDGIGVISSSKQLQEFVRNHHLPLSVPGLNLPFVNVPKDLQELEGQAHKLGLTPEDEHTKASNKFVTLPTPDDARISSADSNGSIRNGMMVFSSLALLFNAAIGHEKYDSVSLLSLDSTHNICANGYCLFAICFFGTSKDGGQTCYPIVYALVKTESYASALVTLVSLTDAVRKLWGIEMVIKIGSVSDRSDSLRNALNAVLPSSNGGNGIHGSCWMHLKQKFWPNKDGKTSNWLRFVKRHGPDWLHGTASDDINKLQLAPTLASFRTLWSLIKEVWTNEGEECIANHCAEYYSENDNWKSFHLYAFPVENTRPNQQPTERDFRTIKGGVDIDAIVNTHASFDQCVRLECKKLVSVKSNDKGGLYRRFVPMLEWNLSDFQQRDRETIHRSSKILDDDIKKEGDTIRYVNRSAYLGQPINEEDIVQFKSTVAGKYVPDAAAPGDFRHHLNRYSSQLQRFCVCTLTSDPYKREYPRRQYWAGSCPYYQIHGRCPHAYRIQHPDDATGFILSGVGKEKRPKKSRKKDGSKSKKAKRSDGQQVFAAATQDTASLVATAATAETSEMMPMAEGEAALGTQDTASLVATAATAKTSVTMPTTEGEAASGTQDAASLVATAATAKTSVTMPTTEGEAPSASARASESRAVAAQPAINAMSARGIGVQNPMSQFHGMACTVEDTPAFRYAYPSIRDEAVTIPKGTLLIVRSVGGCILATTRLPPCSNVFIRTPASLRLLSNEEKEALSLKETDGEVMCNLSQIL